MRKQEQNKPAFYCRHQLTGRVAWCAWLATCEHCCCVDWHCHLLDSTAYWPCCRMLYISKDGQSKK